MAAWAAMDLPAGALNEPVLESLFPPAGAPVRSAFVEKVTASYDRDLSQLPGSFAMDLEDVTATPVAGTVAFTGPTSETGGKRSISFIPAAALTEAASPYTASATVQAVVPTSPTTTTWSFTIDDTPPAPPVFAVPLPGEVRTEQPLFASGTAEAGARIEVVEGVDVIATGQSNLSGSWSIELPYPPEAGVTHTIAATATDLATNQSLPTAPVTFVHKSIFPPPVIVTPAQGAVLASTSVVVSGTSKPGALIRIYEGGPVIATFTANGAGNWSGTVVFAPGTHTIAATQDDGISEDGPTPGRTFTVDIAAPPVPVIDAPAPGAALATSIVTFSGTAEPNASVRVREGAVLRATLAVSGAGGWSGTISFTEGVHTITAQAVDAAGNLSGLASRTFTVDTAEPAIPVISTPAQGAFVGTGIVTVSGSAEAGSTVRVIEGTTVIGTATAGGTGSWSVAISFSNGTHVIRAVAVDAAGNESDPSPDRSFFVDTVAPLAPVIAEPEAGETVTTSMVEVSGTAEPGSTVEVVEGGPVIGTATTDSTGAWAVTITMANGAHSIQARAIDLASNVGPLSAVRTFTVAFFADTTPPPVPVIVTPPPGSVRPPFVLFTGTAEAFSTVRIFEGSEIASTTTDGFGNWQVGRTMSSGPHVVTATATDLAGNASPATAPRTFTVDGARPTVAFTTADGSIFLPTDPALVAGTATDDAGVASIELEYYNVLGNRVLAVTASTCSGCPGLSVTWSHVATLAPGSYDVVARAVDLIGNRSIPERITVYRL